VIGSAPMMGGQGGMDVTDLHEWKQQWDVLWSAPFVMFPSLVIAGSIGWFLQRTKSAGQISMLKERLNLATDQAAIANQAQAEGELKKQIQNLEMAIADKADNDSLLELAADVKVGFAKLATANKGVSSTAKVKLAAALMERWERDRRQP
jgi:hypothetical protein